MVDYLTHREELTIPSPNLVNYVCVLFSVLSATKNVFINRSKLTPRNAAKEAVSYMMGFCNFTCENNKQKISTASVRKDNVASFKKQKKKKQLLCDIL